MASGADFPEELLERFEPGELLGRGSSARVFRARDRESGAAVALKVFAPRGDWEGELPRFLQEAEQARQVEHPHLVPVLDFDVHPGRTSWIAYEFIPGRTLRAHLGDRRDAAVILEWLAQVAEALDALHQQGLAHRDVKPENILIRDDGCAFLCDLGMLRLPQSAIQTTTGRIHGTPHYIAPEIWRGDNKADAASDQFSLGVVMLEALHDRRAYRQDTIGEIFNWAQGSEELDLPEDCSPVLRRALSRAPGARYRDLLELAAALREPPLLLETRQLEVFRTPPPRRLPLAGLLVGGLLLGGLVLGLRDAPPPPPPETPRIEAAETRIRDALSTLRKGHPGKDVWRLDRLREHLVVNRNLYLAANLPRLWRELTEALRDWVVELRRLPPAGAGEERRVQEYLAFSETIRHYMHIFAGLDGGSLRIMSELAFGEKDISMKDITLGRANWVAVMEQVRPLLEEIAAAPGEQPALVLAFGGLLAAALESPHRIQLASVLGNRLADPDLDERVAGPLLVALARCTAGAVQEASPDCATRVRVHRPIDRRAREAPPGSWWSRQTPHLFAIWMSLANRCPGERPELLELATSQLERMDVLWKGGHLPGLTWNPHYVEAHIDVVLEESARAREIFQRFGELNVEARRSRRRR